MSLISGSYSRLVSACFTLLWRTVMVENDDAAVALEVAEIEGQARRAIGLVVALATMLARDRRFREAVLQRLRLKADMT